MKVTENQIQALKEIRDKASSMARQFIKGRSLNSLSNTDYARHEYWSGKAIAIEEVLRILMEGE